MLTSALSLDTDPVSFSPIAPPLLPQPLLPQFNFSPLLPLNSNQSKPLQIPWFISRLASSAAVQSPPHSPLLHLSSQPFPSRPLGLILTFDLYLSMQPPSLQLTRKSLRNESHDADLCRIGWRRKKKREKQRGRKKTHTAHSTAERKDKQMAKNECLHKQMPPLD